MWIKTSGTRAWEHLSEINFTSKDTKMLKCVEDDKVLKKRKMAESRKLAVIYKWL